MTARIRYIVAGVIVLLLAVGLAIAIPLANHDPRNTTVNLEQTTP